MWNIWKKLQIVNACQINYAKFSHMSMHSVIFITILLLIREKCDNLQLLVWLQLRSEQSTRAVKSSRVKLSMQSCGDCRGCRAQGRLRGPPRVNSCICSVVSWWDHSSLRKRTASAGHCEMDDIAIWWELSAGEVLRGMDSRSLENRFCCSQLVTFYFGNEIFIIYL